MYVITNRNLKPNGKGLDVFGSKPNLEGPNELRLLRVTRSEKSYKVELIDDRLSKSQVQELKVKHRLDVDPSGTWYASLRVACELMDRARKEKKHLLIYVHGYNNDLADILGTAEKLEKLYNVIVVPFTWPANGGGAISGTTAYLSDKQDARVSADALNQLIAKAQAYHELLTSAGNQKLWQQASKKYPDNPEQAYAYYAELQDKQCKVSINLMCHSMGNYLLKYALKPASSAVRGLVFDNISLVAADANNLEHEQWVECLQVRHRVYIVINEKDHALQWSRRKPGQEQLARLGHYLKNLYASNAFYLDVTDSPWVKNQHTYFVGSAVQKNASLKSMFQALFEGASAEAQMGYQPDLNTYRLAD